MNSRAARKFLKRISRCGPSGTCVAPGLASAEFTGLEIEFGFKFPPDLRLVLSLGLPSGGKFPPWRDAQRRDDLLFDLRWPLKSLLFDIEHNAFWYPAWGERPANLDEAMAIAAREVSSVPPLIPVFAHRYLPGEPCAEGNPVLSVWQTDIIYYGGNLAGYAKHEFGCLGSEPPVNPRKIRFWSDVVEGVGDTFRNDDAV